MAKRNLKSEKVYTTCSDNNAIATEKFEEADVEETMEESCKDEKVGIVNCARLNVRVSPTLDASIVCILDRGAKVSIANDSGNEFYSMYTETGVYGYCMKKFITVEE